MVRFYFATLAFSAVLTAGLDVAIAANPPGDGWRVLFDGKSLDGWEKHGGKAQYRVEDGAIVGNSVPNTSNTFLCTKDTFSDFELEFEVNVGPGLNSGVQVRSKIKENDRVYGPQVEIARAPGPSGYIYGEGTGQGWLSQNRTGRDPSKNDQWNHFRVVCKGANIKTWINGEPVADLTDEESAREGLIGLQVHGVGAREEPLYVRWRNIRVRELK